MSILDQSRALYSDPSRVLAVILNTPNSSETLDIDSWEALQAFLERKSHGESESELSAWERVQKDLDFQLFNPWHETVPRPDQDLSDRSLLILAETSIDCMQSSTFLKLQNVLGTKNDLIKRGMEIFKTIYDKQNFPLVGFLNELVILQSPEVILDALVGAGITLRDIARIRPIDIRACIRDALSRASTEAKLQWSEAKLKLCERYDILATVSGNSKSLNVRQEVIQSDSEISKVLSLLESDKPSDLIKRVPFAPAGTDTEQVRQRALLANAHRVVSRQLGRAACNIAWDSDSPTGGSEETIINLNGRFGNVGIVSLDTSLLPIEALHWPEFHNGFAQAVQQPLVDDLRSIILNHKTKTEQILQSKRRIYGVPPEMVPLAQYRHAGFVYGLLLRSNVSTRVLRTDDLYKYLKLQNECVSAAVILGACVGQRFSSSEAAAKVCFLHIASQVPISGGLEVDTVDIPLTIQSAALTGLGFVYAKSCNRTIIETLLNEMIRKPSGEKSFSEREAVVFASGYSVGLTALGQGQALPSDLALADRLLDLIEPPAFNPTPHATSDNSARVSLLYETVTVNRQATLPGACIALGLAFLGSGDISVADRIRIPSTVDELEANQIRPDSLLFKYLAKSLVMLPVLEPSTDFILSHLPAFLRDPVAALEHREYRTAGSEAPSCVDWLAVFQARMFAITGIGLGLGLKFAGTNSADAKATLLSILKEISIDSDWPSSHCAAQNASRPSPSVGVDKVTLQTCHACILLAASIVGAGSGDLDIYKQVRIFRDKIDESALFGIGQAADMALGFLFLGRKKYSFSSDFFSIACLLAAVVPRFPSSVSDNKSNLQLLRHLFVLASEERAVDRIDVGTLKPVAEAAADDRFMNPPQQKSKRLLLQRRVGTLSVDDDPQGNLSSNRAYISEFSEPTDGEVRKLLGISLDHSIDTRGQLPLSWFTTRPITRIDWRLSVSEIAAVAVPPQGVQARLSELKASRDLIGDKLEKFYLKTSERYVDQLSENNGNRKKCLQLLHETLKAGAPVHVFLDSL